MIICRRVGVGKKMLFSSDNDKRGGRGRSHGGGGGVGISKVCRVGVRVCQLAIAEVFVPVVATVLGVGVSLRALLPAVVSYHHRHHPSPEKSCPQCSRRPRATHEGGRVCPYRIYLKAQDEDEAYLLSVSGGVWA